MVVYHNPDDNWYYDKRYDDKEPERMKGCFYSLFSIIILIIFSLLLSSCKSIQYVPVEKVITEYKTDTVHDSVYLEVLKQDSVVIEKLGDTVFINKWHTQYKDRWREIIQIDTIIKVASVQIPYPVKKKLTKWEETKMEAGGIAIVACISAIIMLIVHWILKIKQIK
jgi:hypothetical protein